MLRKEQGYDALDMAEKLNITKSAYERLESGKTLTWAKYLEDILNALNISANEFFKDIGNNINISNNEGSYGNSYIANGFIFESKELLGKLENLYKAILLEKNDEIVALKANIVEKDKFIQSHLLSIHP